MTFRHTDLGTPLQTWSTAIEAQQVPVLDITGLRRLVVVAAHPDDETLGAGGLIATAAAAGVEVQLIVATNGEASHPDSPTHTPAELSAIRQLEVERAVGLIAPDAPVRLLHLPDGRLSEHIAELTEEIRFSLSSPWREGTWLLSPWIADGHTDHSAAGIAARDAALFRDTKWLQYPIWAWHWGRPENGSVPLGRLLGFPLSAAAKAAKQRALAEHHSQIEPLSPAVGDEPLLPISIREFFDQDREYFVIPESADLQIAQSPLSASNPLPSVSTADDSLTQTFFDDFYGDKSDPWEFETRWYEQRKRELTLAVLPRRRFESAFEPGCSIGVLTAALAERCDRVLAADISLAPLQRAARRLARSTNVELQQLQIPQEWPDGTFDLVVLSEIGYYCGSADLDDLVNKAAQSLGADGVLIACHWRHPVAGYPMGGDEVHRRIQAHPGLRVLAEHVEADFRLDVLMPPPALSVAAVEGLV